METTTRTAMIIGDPGTFAVEYDLVSRVGPLTSHFCIWLGGHRLGDFADVCMLSLPAGQLGHTLLSIGDRHHEEFAKLASRDCLDLVWSNVYVPVDDDWHRSENLHSDPCDWREGAAFHRFVWLEGAPFSEEFRSILFDTAQGARIVWQDADEAPVREIHLAHQTYTSVIRALLRQLKEQTGFLLREPDWVRQQVEERLKEGRRAQDERNRRRKYEQREQQRKSSRQGST